MWALLLRTASAVGRQFMYESTYESHGAHSALCVPSSELYSASE